MKIESKEVAAYGQEWKFRCMQLTNSELEEIFEIEKPKGMTKEDFIEMYRENEMKDY